MAGITTPLDDYFLSASFWEGELFAAEEHGYEITSLAGSQAEVLKHKQTGIVVWSFALDLRRGFGSDHCLLYFYTSERRFRLLVEGGTKCFERFVKDILKDGSNFGLGPDASSKAPDRWISQDEVLINCFWPTQAAWEAAENSLPMPTASAARDFIDTPMHDYLKTRFPDATAYCVPFLCDCAAVTNLMTSNTPALLMPPSTGGKSRPRQAGCNRFGDKEPDWRDIWTVDIWCLDSGELKVIPISGENRLITVQRKRWEVRGEEDALTRVNAGMHLAFLLKTSGHQAAAMQVYRELHDVPNLKHHANFVECIAEWTLLLEANGEIHEAEQVLKKELQQSSETLGDVDNATLELSVCLARFLQRRGSMEALKDAEQLLRKVWEIRRVVLGDQDPQTLQCCASLAFTLREKGRIKESAELYGQVLPIMVKVLGANHPDTICSNNNLACLLQEIGRWQEAEQQFRRVLKRSAKVFGKNHPDTLAATNNLALFLKDKGQLVDSLDLHKQLLESCRQAFGPLHPHTLASMSNLGCVMDELGHLDEAETLHREVIEKSAASLGSDHAETLRFSNNLACLLQSRGQLIEARQLHNEILESRRTNLGSRHLDSLISANNLACLLQEQLDLRQAIKMHEAVVSASEETLGEQHPCTLRFTHDLALALQRRRRNQEAEQLHRRVLQIERDTLGDKHPQTLRSRDSLGCLLRATGRLEEAEEILRDVLQCRTEILGQDHLDTVRSASHLNQVLQEAGDAKKAKGGSRSELNLQEIHKTSSGSQIQPEEVR